MIIHTQIHIYAYVLHLYLFLCLSIYAEVHKFTLMPLIPKQHCKVHSRFISVCYPYYVYLFDQFPQHEISLPSWLHPPPHMGASSSCSGSDWSVPAAQAWNGPAWALAPHAGLSHPMDALLILFGLQDPRPGPSSIPNSGPQWLPWPGVANRMACVIHWLSEFAIVFSSNGLQFSGLIPFIGSQPFPVSLPCFPTGVSFTSHRICLCSPGSSPGPPLPVQA